MLSVLYNRSQFYDKNLRDYCLNSTYESINKMIEREREKEKNKIKPQNEIDYTIQLTLKEIQKLVN